MDNRQNVHLHLCSLMLVMFASLTGYLIAQLQEGLCKEKVAKGAIQQHPLR